MADANCRSHGRSFGRLQVICLVISVAVPLLESCFHPLPWRQFFISAAFSFVYSNAIGTAVYTVLPPVWMRSSRWGAAARWLSRLAVVVAGTVVGCAVGSCLGFVFWGASFPYWAQLTGSFRLCLIVALITSVLLGFYEQMMDLVRTQELQLKTKELERERALKLATEAQLASLESRIHPHFLFNTINSVSSLIHDDPVRAEQLLTQMAALLRFSLDSAQIGLVPAEREMKIVRDYLAIEQARFTNRLRYRIVVPEEAAQVLVPPLSIQSLVENSLKYAVGVSRHGATVEVEGRRSDNGYEFTVIDDGPGFPDLSLPAGHGLHTLTERLRTVFGDRGGLTISSAAGRTAVTMTVPFLGTQTAGLPQTERRP